MLVIACLTVILIKRVWSLEFGVGSSELGVCPTGTLRERSSEFGVGSSELGIRSWEFGVGSSELGIRSWSRRVGNQINYNATEYLLNAHQLVISNQ